VNRVSWLIALFVVTSAAHAIELIGRLETRIQADIKTDQSGIRYLELAPTRYARAITEAIVRAADEGYCIPEMTEAPLYPKE
jgi:hypothetical protein